MNKEIKTHWVRALRSGEYQQGRDQLRMNDSYCCLGVLCDIVDPMGWDLFGYHKGHGSLPAQSILDTINLDSKDTENLICLNDSLKQTFSEIADWIEERL